MKTIYMDKDIPRILLTKASYKFAPNLLYTGINAVKTKKVHDPSLPADNWVRVKNIACGLCGTDMSFFKSSVGIDTVLATLPTGKRTFLGHENVGEIIEVGKSVANLKVGDRVTIRAYLSNCASKGISPPCKNCAEGNYYICQNYCEPGPIDVKWSGAGWSDTFIAPEQNLTKLLPEITDEQAVMIEPASVSVHAVLMLPPDKREKILVMGGGTIGLGICQTIKIVEPDCEIWIMERIKSKQEFALSLGADHILSGDIYESASKATDGSNVYHEMKDIKMFLGGFDRIYDCIGGDWSNTTAIRLLKARGTLIKIGFNMNKITVDETPVWLQELKIIGVYGHGMEEWQGRKLYTFDLVQEWIRDGIYKTEGFVTHHFNIDRYKDAMRLALANNPEVIKIVLDFD